MNANWDYFLPLLKDPAQTTYEVIRPVVLWGQTPKERAAETGVSYRTIYYKANLFDQAGMASLLPPALPAEQPFVTALLENKKKNSGVPIHKRLKA